MSLVIGRELTSEDIATANRLLTLHTPYEANGGVARCCSASHQCTRLGPLWPCSRARWAERVLDAAQRGAVDQ